MKKRFVLVQPWASSGSYVLVCNNWGSEHFDSAAQAVNAADTLRLSLKEKLGITDVIVIEADCYDHGDCCNTVFSEEYVKQYGIV